MTLQLKTVLQQRRMSQQSLGEACGISQAAVAQIINHNIWPKKPEADVLKPRILKALDADASVFEECRATAATDGTAIPEPLNQKQALEAIMLLRKQQLTPQARRHFGLHRDPFDEVRAASEVFLSKEVRYVREALRAIARHGGFVAVAGESGSGKSTIRRDLYDWIAQDASHVVVIEPYVLGSEDNDDKGKTMKAMQIADAILYTLMPREPVKRSPEARFRQVHNALRESHRAGNRHLLVIEEAHSLPLPTLKQLKRFYELEDGFSKLLGIVLIGQNELAQKLDERDPRVREVVQRCELVTLQPLGTELGNYLKHRFAMAEKPLDAVMTTDAVEALFAKLAGRPGAGGWSALYPLAVHNVVIAALNQAAALGVPQVTGELVREV